MAVMNTTGNNSTFSEEYLVVLRRFDVIIILGFSTFPLALYVYYKLLTIKRFKNNYIFRLIAISGVLINDCAQEFLVYLTDLFFVQCATFSTFNGFFDFLNDKGLSRFAISSYAALIFMKILLSIAVALNRLLFVVKEIFLQMHGRLLFLASIGASLVVSLVCSAILHEPHFTYETFYQGAGVYAHIPMSGAEPSYLGTPLLVLSVCAVLLLASIFLARSVCIYRSQLSPGNRNNAENGLIVVAVSNFVNYVLLISAGILGKYFDILFLSFSRSLFITIACVFPFWYLLIFGKSMRRTLFPRNIFKVCIPSIASDSDGFTSEEQGVRNGQSPSPCNSISVLPQQTQVVR